MHSQGWTYVWSSVRQDTLHPYSARLRPRLFLSPCLLVCRPHVSISPALPGALAYFDKLSTSLGASLSSGHPAWSPAPIAERAFDGLLRSVCPFSVTLGRHCTPRPSYRVITTYAPHITWPSGDVSLLGLPVSASQTLAVWQVLTHDAYVPSSNILTLVTRSRYHRFRLAAYTCTARKCMCPLSTLALRPCG